MAEPHGMFVLDPAKYKGVNMPKTELFMLSSLDGKVSTGVSEERDFDVDLLLMEGDVADGLHQYYEKQNETYEWSFNTGKVLSKVGWNKKDIDLVTKREFNMAVVDGLNMSSNHLTGLGVRALAKSVNQLVIITSNRDHAAIRYGLHDKLDNLCVILCERGLPIHNVFLALKKEFIADKITIQSGPTINTLLFSDGCIDSVHIIMAPFMVNQSTAPGITGMDWDDSGWMERCVRLKSTSVALMENGYIDLRYDVLK